MARFVEENAAKRIVEKMRNELAKATKDLAPKEYVDQKEENLQEQLNNIIPLEADEIKTLF